MNPSVTDCKSVSFKTQGLNAPGIPLTLHWAGSQCWPIIISARSATAGSTSRGLLSVTPQNPLMGLERCQGPHRDGAGVYSVVTLFTIQHDLRCLSVCININLHRFQQFYTMLVDYFYIIFAYAFINQYVSLQLILRS